MMKKTYLQKRNELMAEAKKLLAEGKFEELEAKKKEIEKLDVDFEAKSKEQANLDALENKTIGMNLENISTHVAGNVVAKTSMAEEVNYENVFAKVALRKELTQEEIEVYNKLNPENAYTHSTQNTEILIPTSVVGGIQDMMKELHPVLDELNETTIKGIVKYKKHKSIAAGDAKYYAENTETDEEENTFGEITLNGHELAKYVNVKWKLAQMAVEEFIPFIKREIATRMAAAKANAILKGTGSDQPKGIVTYITDTATTQKVDSQSLKYEDFTAAMAKIAAEFKSGCKIYCNNNSLWNGIANLMDKTGKPLFIPSPVEGMPGKVLGVSVLEEDALADGEILIGNVKEGWKMNKQEPMKLLTGENVKKRETFFGGYEVNDGAVYADEAFALIKAAKLNGLLG